MAGRHVIKANTIMKTPLKSFLPPILALAASAGTLLAQPYTIDENGNGFTYVAFFPPLRLSASLAPDPTGGITNANVLMYNLGYLVTPGDVGLVEPGQSSLSDLIRFYTAPGANSSIAIFYSDIDTDDPTPDLADVGIPYSPNTILINEVSLGGGTNGAVWDPGSLDVPGPGSFAGAALPVYAGPFIYTIISDVPEPGTTALLLGGAGIGFGLQRCRRRKA